MAIKELLGFYILRKLLGAERARRFDAASRRYAPRTASVIFGVMSIVHTLRLVFEWDVIIAGQIIPGWVSIAAVIATAYLSYSLWPTNRI